MSLCHSKNFQKKYNINVNFLQFHSVLHMVPQTWKGIITNSQKPIEKKETTFVYEFVKKLRICHFFSKKILDN